MTRLALSLFHGADLFGLAFEREGWCVVAGPDVMFGRDIRDFHPPTGRFDLLIGSPPCQSFSPLVHLVRACGHEPKHGNLIPEFERCVAEAAPPAFIMEEVPTAPVPTVEGYATHSCVLNNAALDAGEALGHAQMRRRRFSFGVRGRQSVDLRRWITWAALELPAAYGVSANAHRDGARPSQKARTVVARELTGARCLAVSGQQARRGKRAPSYHQARSWAECCALQGMPETWLDGAPFTREGKFTLLGNGVPLGTGRAIARAVNAALGEREQ